MERLDALTGMRGVAALLVVGFHAVLVTWLAQQAFGWPADAFEHPLSRWLLGGGWIGVDFFFVLSGFLLAGPLLRSKPGRLAARSHFHGSATSPSTSRASTPKAPTGPAPSPSRAPLPFRVLMSSPDAHGEVSTPAGHAPRWEGFRVYAAKRLLRIAPPYYVSFLLVFLLVGWTGSVFYRASAEGLLLHALYLHNFVPEQQFAINGVAWTLAVELQFYLLLPLLVLPFRRFGPIMAIPFMAAAVGYLAWAYDPTDGERTRFLAFQFPAFLGHFGLGIAAAQLWGRGWTLPVPPDATLVVVVLAFIVVPAVLLGYTGQFEPIDVPAYYLALRPMAAFAFAIAILCALRPRSLAGRLLRQRPVVWTGDISYSVYLVHLAVGGLALVHGWQWAFRYGLPTFALGMLVATLFVAWLFYLAVEKPSLALKDRVVARLRPVPRQEEPVAHA